MRRKQRASYVTFLISGSSLTGWYFFNIELVLYIAIVLLFILTLYMISSGGYDIEERVSEIEK